MSFYWNTFDCSLTTFSFPDPALFDSNHPNSIYSTNLMTSISS